MKLSLSSIILMALSLNNDATARNLRGSSSDKHNHVERTLSKLTLGSSGGMNPVLPIKAGMEPTAPITKLNLYQGIKTNINSDGTILRPKLFQYNEDDIIRTFSNRQTYEFNTVIQKQSDINDAIGIDGSLSVATGPVSGSGAGNYLSSHSATKNSVTFLYTVRHQVYSELPNENAYKPVHVVSTMINNNQYHELAEHYGTSFINSIIFGMQLDIKFTISSESDVDAEDIQAHIAANIGSGKGMTGDIAAKFNSTKTSKHELYTMTIEATSMGTNIFVPANPSFEEVGGIVDQFNGHFNSTIRQIRKIGINEASKNITGALAAVAVGYADTSTYLPQLNADDHAKIERRLISNAKTMQSTILAMGQLEAQKTFLTQTFTDGKDLHDYYYPWNRKYQDFYNHVLLPKLQECEGFQEQNVTEILNSVNNVPSALSTDAQRVIKGLLGKGYVAAPVTLEDKNFTDMYWDNGYVLFDWTVDDHGEVVIDDDKPSRPFIQGSLFCEKNDEMVGHQNTTHILARTIPITACSDPTPPPTPTPTPSPSQPQCTTRDPYCPSDGICCESSQGGPYCTNSAGTDDTGCCNMIPYEPTVCMKCDNPDGTGNCVPYFSSEPSASPTATMFESSSPPTESMYPSSSPTN